MPCSQHFESEPPMPDRLRLDLPPAARSALAAASPGETITVRWEPLDPQPSHPMPSAAVQLKSDGTPWIVHYDPETKSRSAGVSPHPAPAPETEVWVPEEWVRYQVVTRVRMPDGRSFDEIGDGQAGYRLDGHETPADLAEHVRLMVGASCVAVEVESDEWRPASEMPAWAARLFATIVSRDVAPWCDDCQGEGVVECPACDGFKQLYEPDNGERCDDCDDDGIASCPTCHGTPAWVPTAKVRRESP